MENQEHIKNLFTKYLDGYYTKKELAELLQHFELMEDGEYLKFLIEQELNTSHDFSTSQQQINEIHDYVHTELNYKIRHKEKRDFYIRLFAGAAILLLISLLAIYFLKQPDRKTSQQVQLIAQDVKPGKQAATLTLADGRKIFLSDAINGKIAEESGVRITKDKNGLISYEISEDQSEANSTNTLSTSRGETYQVILPDKSKVWLNAASSITYSTSLRERGGERRVLLSGEAYFVITKDKTRPFIVKTNAQEVKVLGTHFNVNSYADKNRIVTTLEEGSVMVNPLDKKINPVVLKPGQQSLLNGASLSIEPANLEAVLGWKNGLFVFEQASVPDVMKEISRWYNIDVEYNGKIPDDKIGGGISRQSDLSAVLRMLELVNVKYKIVSTTSSGSLKIVINP